MTVSSDTAKARYSGNGSTDTFSTAFAFLENSHVAVILTSEAGVETTWIENTQYTLTGAGTGSAGTVTALHSGTDYRPQTGELLTIIRNVPFTQELDGGALTTLSAYDLENALDKLWHGMGEIKENIERCVALSPGSSEDVIDISDLPAAIDAANAAADDAAASAILADTSAGEAAASAAAALAWYHITWLGTWSGAQAYVLYDSVSLNGASYICITPHTNHTPPNATYWGILAEKGLSGTGSGDMVAANNLSDLADKPTARTNLGVAIGSQVQAYDAELAALAGLTSAADKGMHFTGSGAAAVHDLTAVGRTLLAQTTQALMRTTGLGLTTVGDAVAIAANAAAARTAIGAVIGTDVQAYSSELTATYTHGADIASASTVNLETATGQVVDVTGTTTITAITLNEGHERTVRFTGALILTNGSSLVLPGAANITTGTGDFAVFRGYAAGVVRCVNFAPATQARMQSLIGAAGVSSKIITFTRDAAAATADVAYTGVGFTPTALIIHGVNNETERAYLLIGFSDSSKASRLSYFNANETPDLVTFEGAVVAALVRADDVSNPMTANGNKATVKTYDADGFTLTWTKTGAPGAFTGTFSVLCLK